MRRIGSTWVFFLTMILGVALSLALLPACGSSGGGGSSCNYDETSAADQESTVEVVAEGAEGDCELEEGEEEFEIHTLNENLESDRYQNEEGLLNEGIEASEIFYEVYYCGDGVPCDEGL